jgi:hypothetical protein
MRSIILLALMGLLGPVSCSEVVSTSGPHPAISGDAVKIYSKPPGKYEVLGVVTLALTKEMGWTDDGDGTEAFDRLKAQAGAMGANGLLLKLDNSTYDYQLGEGYHGKSYDVAIKNDPKTAMAKAIFVISKTRLLDPNEDQ